MVAGFCLNMVGKHRKTYDVPIIMFPLEMAIWCDHIFRQQPYNFTWQQSETRDSLFRWLHCVNHWLNFLLQKHRWKLKLVPWNWVMKKTRNWALLEGKSRIKDVTWNGPLDLLCISLCLLENQMFCARWCQHDRDRYHACSTTFKILVWKDLGNWGEGKQKDELACLSIHLFCLSLYLCIECAISNELWTNEYPSIFYHYSY